MLKIKVFLVMDSTIILLICESGSDAMYCCKHQPFPSSNVMSLEHC